jgi:hypothetical protein
MFLQCFVISALVSTLEAQGFRGFTREYGAIARACAAAREARIRRR